MTQLKKGQLIYHKKIGQRGKILKIDEHPKSGEPPIKVRLEYMGEVWAEERWLEPLDPRNQMTQPKEELIEELAKWLFESRYRFPNQRFYANWYDEINASPLTHKEYRNLANEVIVKLGITSSSEIQELERAAMERVRQALNKENEPDAAKWQDGQGRKLSKVLLFTKRQWDKFWKDVESELMGEGEG